MRAIKYGGRLFWEFIGFAWHNKAWWIIPIVLVLLLMGVLITTTQTVAPVIYKIF